MDNQNNYATQLGHLMVSLVMLFNSSILAYGRTSDKEIWIAYGIIEFFCYFVRRERANIVFHNFYYLNIIACEIVRYIFFFTYILKSWYDFISYLMIINQSLHKDTFLDNDELLSNQDHFFRSDKYIN